MVELVSTNKYKEGIDYFVYTTSFTKKNPDVIKNLINEDKFIFVLMTEEDTKSVFLNPSILRKFQYSLLKLLDICNKDYYTSKLYKKKLNLLGLVPSHFICIYTGITLNHFKRIVHSFLNDIWYPPAGYQLYPPAKKNN